MKCKSLRFSQNRTYDAQETEVCAYCAECDGEVYREEIVYEIDGEVICDECIGEFAKKYFSPERIKGEDLKEMTRYI